MTGAELAAEIAEAIAQDSRLDAIREKIEAGTADLKDSEQYTAICAEITGRMMRGAVAGLDDREESFTEIARERYRETFDIYSAVQAIVDRALGIRIAAQEPGFQEDRARKIGHALEDQTVPESTILRRAESASENFVMSQHDRCVEENAKFRDRAGLQSYAVRTGGAKCCQWCADVSGKYPANETPDGFWGRHDNCKCSILYESRRGTQLLGGTSKKWEVVAEGAGAGELHRLSGAEAASAGAGAVHRMSGRSSNIPIDAQPIQNSKKELLALAKYARDRGIEYHNPMDFDGDIILMMRQIDAIASIRSEYNITHKLTICTSTLLGDDLGQTAEDGRTITLNISALRDLTKTNDYLNSDNWFSSTSDIGISIHEMGHVIHKQYGGIGLDIARKTCYNLTGKQMEYQEVIKYLFSSMSEYSVFLYPKQRDKPFSPKLYREIIPEVLAKHATNPDDFTTEFVRILKEGCGL